MINMERKKISLYDSSQQYTASHHDRMIKNCLEFLKFEAETKKNGTFVGEDWSISIEHCPQQSNNYDCGYFMCQIFSNAAREKDLNFKQEHFNYMKKMMCYEFATGQLLM